MLRSLLRIGGAVAFAALLMPGVPSAQPAPGLAYDEIVRMVTGGPPPAPGNFQSDYAAVAPAPQSGGASATAASPTPAPRRGGFGGLGGIAGAILGAGGGGGAGPAGAPPGMAAAMSFLQGRLTRFAFWNGWERVDDVAAQTATIRKCDIGQVIRLDLARKTYSVFEPAAEPTPAAAGPFGPPGAGPPRPAGPPAPAQPGTAVGELVATTTALGPKTIENQNTDGYESTTSFTMKDATGSCRNSTASFKTTEYLAPLSRPAVTTCPVRQRAPIPQSAADMMVPPDAGGCQPTFTQRTNGPAIPAGRLSLYTLMSMAAGEAGNVGYLTERGNLKTLGPSDASLFDIPAGFTKVP